MLQSLFDETQLVEQYNLLPSKIPNRSNIRLARTIRIQKIKMIKSLKSVHSAFVPACMTHTILLNR